VFQIWQGTKQKEFGISATQLQAGIAPWQSAQALAVAIATEMYCYDGASVCDSSAAFMSAASAGHPVKRHVMVLVLGTCFLALAVNLCSFGLIGRTSPITFQVVGHAKTCLVLVGGYLMFPSKAADTAQLQNNILGVAVAMIGVVLYGHLKHAAGQEASDCLDNSCPTCCLAILEPERSRNSEETQGLKTAANA